MWVMRFQHLPKSSSIGSNKIGVGVTYEVFGLDQRLHRANSDIVGPMNESSAHCWNLITHVGYMCIHSVGVASNLSGPC